MKRLLLFLIFFSSPKKYRDIQNKTTRQPKYDTKIFVFIFAQIASALTQFGPTSNFSSVYIFIWFFFASSKKSFHCVRIFFMTLIYIISLFLFLFKMRTNRTEKWFLSKIKSSLTRRPTDCLINAVWDLYLFIC